MVSLGFIGFGSMGRMLIEGFIKYGHLSQNQIIVTRKNKNRLDEIISLWPNMNITEDIIEVVKKAKFIFICAKPLEYKSILDDIRSVILTNQHIISLAGSVSMESMEKIISCKITKVIPTIVSEVNEGISLVCHNSRVTAEDAATIESLFKNISKIELLEEKDLGFASELTSCGPGLIAAIFKEFVESGLRHTNSLNEKNIEQLLLYTLSGTAKLILERKMSFEDIISRVATKGGITEEGVKVIKASIPHVFNEMFNQTMNKRKIVSEKVSKELEL